jgi:hypothetical protein
MDPNAILESIRELVASNEQRILSPSDGDTLAELVGALDEWLSRGGFLPGAWRPYLNSDKRVPPVDARYDTATGKPDHDRKACLYPAGCTGCNPIVDDDNDDEMANRIADHERALMTEAYDHHFGE